MDDTVGIALARHAFGPRRINQAGLRLIKDFEGLRLTAYLCPAKIWTIGYGHTQAARPGMTITAEQAELLLEDDLHPIEQHVEKSAQVPLGDNQFSALVCFAFNVGRTNFSQSTLLRLLNRGWYEQVPAQLSRWNRARGEALGGLARRRAAEARLWNRPDDGAGRQS
ncbi:MAG: lysozyme [Alphaproteobacteria bacterium]